MMSNKISDASKFGINDGDLQCLCLELHLLNRIDRIPFAKCAPIELLRGFIGTNSGR